METPKKSNTGIVVSIVVVVVVFGLIALIGSSASNSNSPAPVNPTPPEQNSVAAVTTQTPPAQPLATFGDGTFIVGSDVQPGTYRNNGTSGCYYARLSGFDGTTGNILANGNSDSQVIITIKPTDKGFESSGCGTWAQLSPVTSQNVKSNAAAAITPTNSNPSQQPAPAPAPQSTQTNWSSFPKVMFSSFANAPNAYLATQLEMKGEVGDFLPQGGRGGSHNYIGVADPNAQTSEGVMLEIDNNSDYLSAVNALQKYDLVAAYGTGVGTASFTMNGQNQLVPVLQVSRLDLVGGCDIGGCLVSSDNVIFPAGATPLTTTSNGTTQQPSSPTPSAPANPRYFQLNISGVCTNYGNNGTIILTGYPYANGYEVPSNDISAWSDGNVAFTVPSGVTAGTYQVDVRGYMQGTGSCPDVNGGSITIQ